MSEATQETTETTQAATSSGIKVSISSPVTGGNEPHPVATALHEHLISRISTALENVPEDIERDFSACVDWVKSHL